MAERQARPKSQASSPLLLALQELDDERAALKSHQVELRKAHTALHLEQEAKEAALQQAQAKCMDVQLLKFGAAIDVSLLDTLGVQHKGAEELKDQLRQQVGQQGPLVGTGMEKVHCVERLHGLFDPGNIIPNEY
jgi:hypothetical protein